MVENRFLYNLFYWNGSREVLANRIDKWFKSRSDLKNEMKTKNEFEFDFSNQIQTQNVNEDINGLKNKIDGR